MRVYVCVCVYIYIYAHIFCSGIPRLTPAINYHTELYIRFQRAQLSRYMSGRLGFFLPTPFVFDKKRGGLQAYNAETENWCHNPKRKTYKALYLSLRAAIKLRLGGIGANCSNHSDIKAFSDRLRLTSRLQDFSG